MLITIIPGINAVLSYLYAGRIGVAELTIFERCRISTGDSLTYSVSSIWQGDVGRETLAGRAGQRQCRLPLLASSMDIQQRATRARKRALAAAKHVEVRWLSVAWLVVLLG